MFAWATGRVQLSPTEKGKPVQRAHLRRECRDFRLGCVKFERTSSLSKGRGGAGSLMDGSGGRGSGLGREFGSTRKRDPLRGHQLREP